MPPPLAPVAPADAGSPAQSAPVSAPPAPAAAAEPLAPPAVSPAPLPDAAVVDPPVLVPAAHVAPLAAVPAVSAPAVALSPQASATTGGPASLLAPPAGQPSRPSSPDRRPSRPHSPALHQERESSQRRRDSPRRYHQQSHWPAHPGGHAGWRGPRGRGGGGAYRPPVTMADLQREVSRAVRVEREAQSQSSSLRDAPAQVAPLAGVEFVAAGGGAAGPQNSLYLGADEPHSFLAVALQPPQTRVPEATLGQLHRLAESLHALLLIQVVAHSSLPAIPAESFRDRPRETCLDAADQLAQLLAPALAAPAEGGAAAVGQLDEDVRGLRRHLRAGSGFRV
ncbi:unnamed protein product [Closterium sp. Naga37s-1]|nr:unnamed protein product [Closterium sp. Naga37s-1]